MFIEIMLMAILEIILLMGEWFTVSVIFRPLDIIRDGLLDSPELLSVLFDSCIKVEIVGVPVMCSRNEST